MGPNPTQSQDIKIQALARFLLHIFSMCIIYFFPNQKILKKESEHLKKTHSYNCHYSMEYRIILKAYDSTIRHRHIRANLVGCQLYLQFGVI